MKVSCAIQASGQFSFAAKCCFAIFQHITFRRNVIKLDFLQKFADCQLFSISTNLDLPCRSNNIHCTHTLTQKSKQTIRLVCLLRALLCMSYTAKQMNRYWISCDSSCKYKYWLENIAIVIFVRIFFCVSWAQCKSDKGRMASVCSGVCVFFSSAKEKQKKSGKIAGSNGIVCRINGIFARRLLSVGAM